jgi:hypothetical protein
MLRVWPLSCLLIFILCKYQIRKLTLEYVEYQDCNTSSLQWVQVKTEDTLFPYRRAQLLKNRTRKEHPLSLISRACTIQLLRTPSQLSQAPAKPRSPTKSSEKLRLLSDSRASTYSPRSKVSHSLPLRPV